jgi:hypothetical protein
MKTFPLGGASSASLDTCNNPLLLDLLEWLSPGPRRYAEVMEAWRTSCPKLPIWEDAVDGGLVLRRVMVGQGAFVELTPAGRALIVRRGRTKPRSAP